MCICSIRAALKDFCLVVLLTWPANAAAQPHPGFSKLGESPTIPVGSLTVSSSMWKTSATGGAGQAAAAAVGNGCEWCGKRRVAA